MDLPGEALVGAIVISPGLPQVGLSARQRRRRRGDLVERGADLFERLLERHAVVEVAGERDIQRRQLLARDGAEVVLEPVDHAVPLDPGAFDAVFVSDAGIVREATSSNFFIASGGVLVTHPLTENILAGIGPSLGPCCGEFVNYRKELPEGFWKYGDDANRFDFWAVSRDQLTASGVREKNIHLSRLCTKCRTDLFFSYRGEGTTGRFMAVIGLE